MEGIYVNKVSIKHNSAMVYTLLKQERGVRESQKRSTRDVYVRRYFGFLKLYFTGRVENCRVSVDKIMRGIGAISRSGAPIRAYTGDGVALHRN